MTRPITSAVFVAIAILAFLLGWLVGRPPPVGPHGGGPTVSAATIDVKCNDGTKYTLTTGNDHGGCTATSGPDNIVANCDDGKGNHADLNCSKGCTSTKGSGRCQFK
jgi:hypothetical protein